MLALTKEEAVRRHRELWNKIAELCTESHFSSCGFSVFKIKSMALNALGYDDPIKFPDSMCWACEYAIYNAIYLRRTNKGICCFCPIKWKTNCATIKVENTICGVVTYRTEITKKQPKWQELLLICLRKRR